MTGGTVPWTQRTAAALRHPMRWLQESCGGGPATALLILFGLNAVDELGRSGFAVLGPNIAEYFDTGIGGISIVVTLALAASLALTVPVATLADRHNRVRLALLGGVLLSVFQVGVGLAPTIWVLGVMLAGMSIGKAVIDPTHNSLIADYFPVGVRPRVYSIHRAANAVGQFVGPLSAGLIAAAWGWRAPFIVFAVPTVVLVLVGLRLREPVRGAHERRAHGASAEVVDTEEEPPSFTEAWRLCWKIDSLRRIYRTLPFLAPAMIGFLTFASFLYADVFGLDEQARGLLLSLTEPFQLLGLVVGARLGMRAFSKDPAELFTLLAKVIGAVTVLALVFAWAPNVWVAVLANIGITAGLAAVLPGIFAALSLAIPPRARAMGFAMGSVFILPGLIAVPIIGAIGDEWGIRWGMTAMVPVFLFGGLAIASARHLVQRDIADVWRATAARAEALHERRAGRAKLLLVRGLEVSYGGTQVLFGVDMEVGEGQVVALLGTNGAGKSTLLKAICGVVEADHGAVILDGRDTTHAPPHEITAHGVSMLPGGQGVFRSLTVAENLRAAGWLDRRHRRRLAERTEQVLDLFPALRARLHEPAANLSGGQQQMLALAMAFLRRPTLLLLDELSLGLAPAVVEQLVRLVRALQQQGTTVVVVEQSVNVALTLADEAYFLEKGEVRFHGPTAELLDRPDVLRAVFLEGAAAAMGVGAGNGESGLRDQGAHGPLDRANASPDGDAPALELVGVSRRFGGLQAVDEVSLEVQPGEIVGLIGPNGAGKTTLFDVVSGFTLPSTGRVHLGGIDVTTWSPERRARLGLGRSFQDAALFPALTVEHAIAVALERWVTVREPVEAALHLPAAFDSELAVAERVDELVARFGLERYRNAFVHELSTGTRRIVDLACLVAHEPTVILLDEPSTGIAQREAEALAPVLRSLRDDLGASLLLIEHDMPLVTAVADRLVALEQGRVVATGPPHDVLRDPAVVAAYLGTTEAVIARSGAR